MTNQEEIGNHERSFTTISKVSRSVEEIERRATLVDSHHERSWNHSNRLEKVESKVNLWIEWWTIKSTTTIHWSQSSKRIYTTFQIQNETINHVCLKEVKRLEIVCRFQKSQRNYTKRQILAFVACKLKKQIRESEMIHQVELERRLQSLQNKDERRVKDNVQNKVRTLRILDDVFWIDKCFCDFAKNCQ